MTRPLLLFAAILLILSLPVASQDKAEPFAGNHILRDRKQIAAMTNWPPLSNVVYNYTTFPIIGDSMVVGAPYTFPDSLQLPAYGIVDMVVGNFIGDDLDEVATAWELADQSICVAIWRVEQGTHNWSNIALWKTTPLKLWRSSTDCYTRCPIFRLKKGAFDADEHDELLLACVAVDTTVTLLLYDTDDGVTFHETARVSGPKNYTQYPDDEHPFTQQAEPMSVAVTDVNADGTDEAVVVGVEVLSGSWEVYLRIYDLSSGAFVPRMRSTLFSSTEATGTPVPLVLDMETAPFVSGPGATCIVGWQIPNFSGGTSYRSMQAIHLAADLEHLFVGPAVPVKAWSSDYGFPRMASGDVNLNGIPELVLCGTANLEIFRIDSAFVIHQLFDRPGQYYFNDIRALMVADVNSDLSTRWSPEIAVVTHQDINYSPWWYMNLEFFETVLDSAGNITDVVSTHIHRLPNYWQGWMAAGRFDRGDVRLGNPVLRSKTAIVQPLVILNAPPIHFDRFDDASYDICKAYGQTPCDFVSTYEKSSSTTLELQTTISRNWAQSFSISAGFSAFGIGMQASLEQRYGASFSKEQGSSNTIRIGVRVDALDDDYLYATVAQYDFWEYPAYAGGELIGHLLVLDPNASSVQHGWFSSKDWNASSYVPNHEVGNVLSYQRFADLRDNPELGALIKGSNSVFFSLNATSSAEWSLAFSDFASAGVTTTETASLEVGASISGWGVSVGVEDSYSEENTWTHKTTVMSDLGLRVRLGSVDMGVGEVAYQVTPYTYWGKNGALVLDYAVAPKIAEPGYTPTWWQVHYNKPDPAFILPWRYDPEKGYTLQEPAKRYQTKEITFAPDEPVRDQPVRITARVRNFGLLPTDSAVAVRFYAGDPDSGGVPLVGTGGETVVWTNGSIPARGWKTVELEWKVSMGVPQYPRIYAVIDPDNLVDEVHPANNKGFTVMNLASFPTGVEEERNIPRETALEQNYPNPFNPSTMIDYRLSMGGMVKISVFDLLGREVTVLVNEEKPAGKYAVTWNASGMTSGIYFCTLQVGEFRQTRKLVLVQ